MSIKIIRGDSNEMLREHLLMETEGERSPAQSAEAEEIAALEKQFEESGIRRVEQLLEGDIHRKVVSLKPETWREMSALQQQIMIDWTERKIKVLSERLCMMRRNSKDGPETPDWLKLA